MRTEVSIRADISDKQSLLKEFFTTFDFYSDSDKEKINLAWNLLCDNSSDKLSSDGNPYYVHALRLAYILAQNKMDAETICAAILHTIYDFGITKEQIHSLFDENTYSIIDGATKIMHMHVGHSTIQQADATRKMLFAMVDDVRVILIKIADKLDQIRCINSLDEIEQRSLAKEILDIWAPLADRLGMQEEKNEFEDLSLKYTNPDVFQQIKSIVSQTKEERKLYLDKALQQIYKAAQREGINDITIKSRAKHFYSIYQKMRKRNVEPDKLYDLLAIRILCNESSECYTIVGLVHSLWKPLDGRFKDYIAMPKANGYQSLHTTVMCGTKPLEIQIRTKAMDEAAEHGIASHWLYKKGTNHDLVDVNHLGIFNNLRELRDGHVSDESFFSAIKNDLLGDEIYVFTPKGEVIQLPAGSNAIDFAYHIHSAIGEKIVGAKADGKIIPITQPLKNTQIIEILTNPKAHPTVTQHSAVRTSKARQKIHAWLSANDSTFAEKQTLPKIDVDQINIQTTTETHKRKKGKGSKVQEVTTQQHKIKIGNTTNFFVTFAQCCKPTYPEAIVGYISKNRGITVHRADCYTYQRIQNITNRTIEISWED